MAAFDAIATNVLGAVAYAAGAFITVEYVLPKVRMIAAEVLRYPKTAEALVYLLSILVYVAAAQGIIGKVAAIGIPALNYANVVTPALEVINGIMPVIRTLVIGIGIVLLAERVRLRA